MQPLIERRVGDRVARIAHSTRTDGDLSPADVPHGELADRRRRALDRPWCALRQVHSDRVITASGPPPHDRPAGDALVTVRSDIALAVHSGDCVPIGLISLGGAVGAAHAGWKGLEAGVLESCLRRLRQATGPAAVVAAIGPHIRAERYEFGPADLERMASRFGPQVVGTTAGGAPALDLTAAVTSECARLGVEIAAMSEACTAADASRFWSHRARAEVGRIALVAWLEEADR